MKKLAEMMPDKTPSDPLWADDRIEREFYQVTPEDIAAYFDRMGWPTWDALTTDHLKTDAEQATMAKAIEAAQNFCEAVRAGVQGVAMILLAGPVAGDLQRTGYGCGKTTLARIIQYATSFYYPPYRLEDLKLHTRGYFIESRQLMARFDDKDTSYSPIPGSSMLIIDDVGREGTLRWERRDPDLQLLEKQDRYYTIIDHMLQKGRNLVLTSNMSARELADFFGGATWSRLLQMCPPQFRVNMTGLPDMRPVIGAERADNWGF